MLGQQCRAGGHGWSILWGSSAVNQSLYSKAKGLFNPTVQTCQNGQKSLCSCWQELLRPLQGSPLHSSSKAEEMNLLRLPREEPCFSQPRVFSSAPFHCQVTSTLLCRETRSFYIQQGYSQVTFVPYLPMTALETEREKCVRTHAEEELQRLGTIFRWKTGVYIPVSVKPVSKHLPLAGFFSFIFNFSPTSHCGVTGGKSHKQRTNPNIRRKP